jgi:uncharacterized membrane protein YebE (DUF533 family)
MFDAKKLLDVLVASASAPRQQGGSAQPGTAPSASGVDIGPDANAGLGGLLGTVLNQLGGKGQTSQPGAPGSAGTPNVGDLVTRARDFLQTPAGQQTATAVMGGLAGLLLGSKSGRSITTSAAKIGGLGLIAGLAYKAYQAWQSGEAPPASAQGLLPAQPAPAGSAFDAGAASQDTALVLVRAMIAAASCDGHVDPAERGRIVGSLQQTGFDLEATRFLDSEFANPASVTRLAAAATTPELAAQIYTAARLAIEPDTPEETAFLKDLSEALGLDPALAAHLDTAAASTKV